ncbi:mechanosensitive ion channel family protein [Spirulina sp. 06S082]|uniref:mechanosensitive ion channel family protein n=1 Tax=Spirulina sp. 06S082 TaxID=3110248 RepID=UPI002B21692E|nr:mechanosensitive ion channel family protein [Spirulina sp. 06S082]MEA5467639.1 mechanosensitive ion channel family protein [Spirulina sp. 06S082]
MIDKQRLIQQVKSRLLAILSLFLLTLIVTIGISSLSPVSAQLFLPQTLENTLPEIFPLDTEKETSVEWIRLDGKPLFPIVGGEEELSQRVREVQKNLWDIQKYYLNSPDREVEIEIRTSQSLPILYVSDRYLLSITHLDARLQGSDPTTYSETLQEKISNALKASKAERQPQQMRKKARRGIIIFIVVALVSLALNILPAKFARSPSSQPFDEPPIATRLNQRQYRNLSAIRRILRQLSQIALWTIGTLLILSLFPQTRFWQITILEGIKSYLLVGAILILTYVFVRLSYVLIDRSIAAFIQSAELIPKRSTQRLQQRISTISSVTKSISTIFLSIIGILLALVSLGVNIAPLLAGAGLIGVAISLASQNLIKDAINGFLILAEDQYAVGDVIGVGNVFGLVENISLRMTQLRDTEQRLITIPNSEVKIVSNLSSLRSQADIKIPLSYRVNIDEAIALIEQVSEDFAEDANWKEYILEKPQILGLDEFTDRAAIVRVWITTQPLKQWDVGREFRRRIKRACDRAEIPLALGREEVWLLSNKDDASSIVK